MHGRHHTQLYDSFLKTGLKTDLPLPALGSGTSVQPTPRVLSVIQVDKACHAIRGCFEKLGAGDPDSLWAAVAAAGKDGRLRRGLVDRAAGSGLQEEGRRGPEASVPLPLAQALSFLLLP